MSELISRRAAIDAIDRLDIPEDMCVFEILSHIELEIGNLPSAQPEIVRCKDCDYWDSDNGKQGYCTAAKHLYMSRHWEIRIYRTYDADFFCADADRKEEIALQVLPEPYRGGDE